MEKEGKPSKSKPKQRHRLLVDKATADVGLTARIKKALIQQDMGITQRIKKVVAKTQDRNSFLFMQRNHFIIIGTLLFFTVIFGYLALRTRTYSVQLMLPGEESVPAKIRQEAWESETNINLPSYPRKISYDRVDIFGKELKDEDFYVTNKENEKVPDKYRLVPASYTIHINKRGYKDSEIPLRVGESAVEVPVRLEPEVVRKSNLVLYLQDQLLEGERLQPDDVILVNSGRSIKNSQVEPGKYAVEITKEGYIPQKTIIEVKENGVVEEKIKLDYKKRPVRFLIADGLRERGQEPKLDERDITLIQNDQQVSFQQGLLMPGYYQLIVQRDGYSKYEARIKINPGETEFVHRTALKPLAREVILSLSYTDKNIAPADPTPDTAYLKDIYSATGRVIPLEKGLKVAPGRYWVNIEKAQYFPFTQEVFIAPASDPFVIKADLFLMSKLWVVKIVSDYDVDPNITPDEMRVDMEISKAGYESIDWQQLLQSLPPEKKQIQVVINLITKPVRVDAEIRAEGSAAPIVPDTLTLTRIRNGAPEQNFDIKTGQMFKPGRYLLDVEKTGYEPINKEDVVIYPSDKPYQLRRTLKPYRREFLTRVDSDYEPGKDVELDEIRLDGKLIAKGTRINPGEYRVTLKKAGYETVEETIDIVALNKPFDYQKRLRTKLRQVEFKFRGGEEMEIIPPDRVTIDESEIKDGARVPPKREYTVVVEKQGFETLKFTTAIEPSEDRFFFTGTMVPKKRKLILTVKASFPPNLDLLEKYVDICQFGEQNCKTGTIEVIPNGKKPYRLHIVCAGYETIDEDHWVKPGESAIYISKTMQPKLRQVSVNFTYDVASEIEDLPVSVKLRAKEGTEVVELKTGMKILPNDYYLDISAQGYETISESIRVMPSESNYPLSRQLVSLPRPVAFEISGDYPPNEKFADTNIMIDGLSTKVESKIKPGKHTLVIEKDGYHSHQEEIELLAGVNEKLYVRQLKSSPRIVNYRIIDGETSEMLQPEVVSLGTTSVTGIATFKPGRYLLNISLTGYNLINEQQYEVPVGSGPFTIEKTLSPTLRLVKYEITGDYDPTKLLKPQMITLNGDPVDGETKTFSPGGYDLVIYVPGYERHAGTISIEPGTEPHWVRQQLISKRRRVNFNIGGDYPVGIKLKPDKVTFDNNEINNGQEVKPVSAGFQVTIFKDGYETLTQKVVIPPGETDFDLTLQMVARPRRLDLQIDNDYRPGIWMEELDQILVDDKAFTKGDKVNPGDHQITLRKAGFEPLVFTETVGAGTEPHVLRKTLISIPREVRVKVLSELTKEVMEPEIVALSEVPVTESKFKPGGYELHVDHLGYVEIRQKVEVPPGEGPYELERTLETRKRKIQEEITFDVPPPPTLPPHIIRVRSLADPTPIRVRPGDEIKPGDYEVIIEKEGYETLRKRMPVWPDGRAYVIKAELIAKYIQIRIDVSQDIKPEERDYPVFEVTFVDEKGIGRKVTDGKFIRPGHHTLEIEQPGYNFAENGKKIYVQPGTLPFWVRETLTAKPRPMSFGVIYQNRLIQAQQILIDNKAITQADTFKVGEKYNFIAKFEKFATVDKEIVVTPGVGPFKVDMNMVELEKYSLQIHKRFHNMSWNNIRYPIKVLADEKELESHHVVGEEAFPMCEYKFYAPGKTRNIRVQAAFFYEEDIIKPVFSFRDLSKIDPLSLLIHLRQLAKGNRPFEAVRCINEILRDRQDKIKLKELPLAERQKIIGVLNDLELTTDAEKNSRVIAIKELE